MEQNQALDAAACLSIWPHDRRADGIGCAEVMEMNVLIAIALIAVGVALGF